MLMRLTSALVTLARFDLLISALIAIVNVVVGQAIVSYEIFTAKTLPRRGLRRQWGRALLLAAGYGSVVGWALTTQIRPVYVILLATLLMTAFFALLGWRSYAEREWAYLIALGPLAPLAGPPLVCPERSSEPPPLPTLDEVTSQITSPAIAGVPIDPGTYGGARRGHFPSGASGA